jgi:hypothetical protein
VNSIDRFVALRAGYGLLLLGAPGPVARLYAGRGCDRRTVAVARVLGARHLAQAALSARHRSETALGLGVAVDLLHAASMIGLAVLDRSRTRAGLLDATGAAGFAVAGLVVASATREPTPPAPGADPAG